MSHPETTWKEPGRNERCWCGSGLKYKKCHLDRQFEKPLPLQAGEHVLLESWAHKQCLHPLADPKICNHIVSAHSVQKGQTLERIIDSTNHVCTFFPQRSGPNGGLLLHRVGWRKASTFTGFCAKHDSQTFEPLENRVFAGTPEQCFLVAYRAVCHEVYQKLGATQADKALRQIVDKGMPIELQRQIQDSFDLVQAGTRAGLADFQRLKAEMDEQLAAGDYCKWSRAVIRFRGNLCVASTGTVSPNRDLDGRELQVLHDFESRLESLPFGVIATPEGGAVIFTWRNGETAPERFVQSMLQKGKQLLPSLIVQFIFAYVENTYFSGRWWESLSDREREHLTTLAEVSNAYYTDIRYSSAKFVPWEIIDIVC